MRDDEIDLAVFPSRPGKVGWFSPTTEFCDLGIFLSYLSFANARFSYRFRLTSLPTYPGDGGIHEWIHSSRQSLVQTPFVKIPSGSAFHFSIPPGFPFPPTFPHISSYQPGFHHPLQVGDHHGLSSYCVSSQFSPSEPLASFSTLILSLYDFHIVQNDSTLFHLADRIGLCRLGNDAPPPSQPCKLKASTSSYTDV